MSDRGPAGARVGVDIGGSKVLAVAVDDDGRVRRTAGRVTPGRGADPRLLEDAIVAAVHDAAAGEPLLGVGVAAAGWVDATGEHVAFAPHLPWRDAPVRAILAQRLRVPVVLDNDANCAALGEATYGAGRGAASLLMLTLGTGIGGALVLDGRVLRGAGGMAGEYGHMVAVPDGHPCECGNAGCWEQYCSGSALVRYARDRMGLEPTNLEALCAGRPEQLTGPMVTAAAEEGDLVARQAFSEVGTWLGHGLAGLVAALDPAQVVIGGGLSEAGDRLLVTARAELARRLPGAAHRVVPPVRAATLGSASGAVGAVVLLQSRFPSG